jgi:hypothetical protein
MVPDPLGDVGLRPHHALIERAIPGELKIFFLAIGRIGDGADGQDDFDHSEDLYPKTELENITPNRPSRLAFQRDFTFFRSASSPAMWRSQGSVQGSVTDAGVALTPWPAVAGGIYRRQSYDYL